jgi:hypothetical protein
MMRYKEEYVGTTRLRQLDGSQYVSVRFRDGDYAGREVKVRGELKASAARSVKDRAIAMVIAAGNIVASEDRACSTFAEVNARRGY